MKNYTPAQFEEQLLPILTTCGEEQDNRFAVVNETLFELTDYIDCNNGRSYSVIATSQVEGCYYFGADEVEKTPMMMTVFFDDLDAAQKAFSNMLVTALS